MWQAGAAAALSPMPVVDLAAGLGITTHMVLQLARVYRQKMDLDTASQVYEIGDDGAARVITCDDTPGTWGPNDSPGDKAAFCAGADLHWMKSVINQSFEENLKESNRLAGSTLKSYDKSISSRLVDTQPPLKSLHHIF